MWVRSRSGENEGFSSGTSQGADSRLAIGHPFRDLRGLSGRANPGIWRRGPGCALGGKASREGQDMPTKWEPHQACGCHPGRTCTGVPVIRGRGAGSMEDLEALTSTAALSHGVGGEAWRLWEGMVISRCSAQVGTGVRQPQDIVQSGGRSLSSPPSLSSLSFLLSSSLLSFLFLVLRTGPINTFKW